MGSCVRAESENTGHPPFSLNQASWGDWSGLTFFPYSLADIKALLSPSGDPLAGTSTIRRRALPQSIGGRLQRPLASVYTLHLCV